MAQACWVRLRGVSLPPRQSWQCLRSACGFTCPSACSLSPTFSSRTRFAHIWRFLSDTETAPSRSVPNSHRENRAWKKFLECFHPGLGAYQFRYSRCSPPNDWRASISHMAQSSHGKNELCQRALWDLLKCIPRAYLCTELWLNTRISLRCGWCFSPQEVATSS